MKQIDAFGNSLRTEVDRVALQLSNKYGPGKKSDFLLNGAIWDEPQYWMNALEDGQRIYAYMWEKGRQTDLPNDLENIFAGAAAYGGGQGAVTIEYSSTRIAAAETEIEGSMSDLL